MAFSERKVAEMAAYFLLKTEKGIMPHLKLMKLLYLSDRECFRQHGFSMSEDKMVSMPYGPVLSETLNLINGVCQSTPNGWDSLISDKENHQVSVDPKVSVDDLLELSRAEIETMDSVWDKFGSMNQWDIVNYTHNHCPEWEDPEGSSRPIELDTLFKALGFSKIQAKALKEQIAEQEAIDRIFSGR
ncbi:MAG: Panacea domain-containing protein [Candidatus Dadabacteria bacterium]|nr:Panacea domain-containing protein [Candidatus Dadabacteria bacterium]